MTPWQNKYVGIPYALIDRKGTHANCWQLIQRVYKGEHNIDLPAYGELEFKAEHVEKIAEAIEQAAVSSLWSDVHFESYRIHDIRPFDVVIMDDIITVKGKNEVRPVHCGVAVDRMNLLHVERATHALVARMSDPSIRFRLRSVHRYKDFK